MPKELVCGVGINDADYAVNVFDNGKQVMCPIYCTWKNLITRCYGKQNKIKHPTYVNCRVCDEWLTFSNFKNWMVVQDWVGKHLDKDILIKGNTIYSPLTCVFVSKALNNFLVSRDSLRGEYPLGVCWVSDKNKFKAQCSDGKKPKHLGYYSDAESAHTAWKKFKHKLACNLADQQSDSRVAEALKTRFI